MSKPHLTDEQLNKLTTERLMALFKKVRVAHHYAQHDTRYEPDNDWVSYNGYGHVADIKDYHDRIKAILDTREHIK